MTEWLCAIVVLAVLWWLSYRAGSQSRSEKINRESRIKRRKLKEAGNATHERMVNASDAKLDDMLRK